MFENIPEWHGEAPQAADPLQLAIPVPFDLITRRLNSDEH